jgi:hypothetical protein
MDKIQDCRLPPLTCNALKRALEIAAISVRPAGMRRALS